MFAVVLILMLLSNCKRLQVSHPNLYAIVMFIDCCHCAIFLLSLADSYIGQWLQRVLQFVYEEKFLEI